MLLPLYRIDGGQPGLHVNCPESECWNWLSSVISAGFPGFFLARLLRFKSPSGLPPSEMAIKVATSKAAMSWYSHPVYARYWQHYHQAMAWMRNHQVAYRKAVEAYFSFPWYFSNAPQSSYDNSAGSPQSYYGHRMAWQDSHGSYSHDRKAEQPLCDSGRMQPSTRADRALLEKEEVETESDDEVECDLSNMEITDELRQYFAVTEKHREERRHQQQLEAERLKEYVNADHDLYCNNRRTVKAPTERPDHRGRETWWRKSLSLMATRKQRQEGPLSSYGLQGHTSSNLTSSHLAPPPQGATSSQEYHELQTKHSAFRPLGDIQPPNYNSSICFQEYWKSCESTNIMSLDL